MNLQNILHLFADSLIYKRINSITAHFRTYPLRHFTKINLNYFDIELP